MSEFDSPKLMLGWADENVEQLYAICTDLLANAKAALVYDVQPETGYKEYKVRLDKTLPTAATRLTAEAIVHYRHALDQAVVASWRKLGMGDVPDRLYFPFPNSPNDLEGRMKSPPLDKLAPIHEALRTIKPYPCAQRGDAGNDALVALSDAAQRKHTIVPKINGRITNLSLSDGIFDGLVKGPRIPLAWDIEKGEIPVATTLPGGHVEVNIGVALDITLSGAGKLDGTPVLQNLVAIGKQCRSAVALIEEAVS